MRIKIDNFLHLLFTIMHSSIFPNLTQIISFHIIHNFNFLLKSHKLLNFLNINLLIITFGVSNFKIMVSLAT